MKNKSDLNRDFEKCVDCPYMYEYSNSSPAHRIYACTFDSNDVQYNPDPPCDIVEEYYL